MGDELIMESRSVLFYFHEVDGHRRDLRNHDSSQGISDREIGVVQLKLNLILRVL